jgi:hypothetical protein
MPKQMEFNFSSATVAPEQSIKAGFDLDTGQWQATQNIQQYKDHVKQERDKQDYFGRTKYKGYRKMATIPDIVAIKIKEDHHIDLHDPLFSQDSNNMKKLKVILKLEYPDLLVNT